MARSPIENQSRGARSKTWRRLAVAVNCACRSPGEGSCPRSIDFLEVAVTTQTILESCGARGAILDQGLAAVVPLLYQRIANRKPLALDGGAPIHAHACRRE